MSLNELLRRGSVERRAPDPREIRDLARSARRQIQDARVPGLSAEASYQLAYTGVLALATLAVRAAGYRLRGGEGQHRRTFEAARAALGRRRPTGTGDKVREAGSRGEPTNSRSFLG